MKKFKDVKAAFDFLEKGIQNLFKSEKYRDYLNAMAKFHQYSYYNVMLIWSQMPNATMVAGYKTWEKEFGRTVKKGEKGIAILAPIGRKRNVYKKDDNGDIVLDEDGKPVKEEISYLQFRIVYVYDVSQTEGKELPGSLCNMVTSGYEDYDILIEKLKNISPVEVIFSDKNLGKAFGRFDGHTIRIKPDMSEGQTIKTLIHEEAHVLLHKGDFEKNHNIKEIEAESVAFIVCRCLGLDTSDYSFGYVASWSKDKNVKELRSSMENIRIAAQKILNNLKSCQDNDKNIA